MPCEKLTIQEYQTLMASNPNRGSYSTLAECQEKTCCDNGCCREQVVLGRCYRNEPGPFGLGPEWVSTAGSPFWILFVRQRPKINGGCNQADFSPPSNCSAYQEVCEPQPCYTDCLEFGQVCPDPNDPNSCYQDCIRYGEVCPPDNCYQQCISYEGADLTPCDYDGQLSPRSVYPENCFLGRCWGIDPGGGCCPSGECPSYYGECT